MWKRHLSQCLSVYGGFLVALVLLEATPRVMAQSSGLDTPQPVNPFFNGVFPSVAPGQATGWSTENAFPNLTFIDPLWLTPILGSTNLLLVGKSGQIWRFPNNPATTTPKAMEFPMTILGSILPARSWRNTHLFGLRSPHTAHYDALTDEVWIGDVGESEREEMTRLPRGGNAQWGYREGSIAGSGTAAVPPIGTETPPVLDYDHSAGNCIIGGMRYRGTKWNTALGGKLLYADHVLGKIWTATLSTGGGAPVSELVIEGFPTGEKVGLANFCTDTAGEVYLLTVNGTNQPGGTIRKLIVAGVSAEPPPLLSQTGFSAISQL